MPRKPAIPEGRIFQRPYKKRDGTTSLCDTWSVRWLDEHAKRKEQNGFKSEADARRFLLKALSLKAHGQTDQLLENTGIRMAELFDDLESFFVREGKKSLASLRTNLIHLRPAFGHLLPGQVTTDVVNAFRELRSSEGRSPAYINRMMEHLRRAFRLAYQATPPKVERIPYIPRYNESYNVRKDFIDLETYNSLMSAGAEFDFLKPVIACCFACGPRKGELTKLTWNQIDFDEDYPHIRFAADQTKTDEAREIPMTPDMVHWLRKQKELRDSKWPGQQYVFFHHAGPHAGQRLSTFEVHWDRLLDHLGYDVTGEKERRKEQGIRGRYYRPLRLHDFRRSAAREMRQAGVDTVTIKSITGHKTDAMFHRYSIVTKNDRKIAVEKLLTHQQKTEKKPVKSQEGTEKDSVSGAVSGAVAKRGL
jgi:integrase